MRLLRVVVPTLALALLAGLPAEALARKSPLRDTDVTSRGYKGIKRVPRTGPAPAPPAISLGAGKLPDVLVDAAGTSHVVWTEEVPAGGSDVPHYCRIPRGANACDNPNGTPFPPINVPFSADFDGPKIAQLGDGLVVLSHRYPAVVPHPDGQDRDRTTYMWTSADGGQTFTGPAIVGTSQINGDIAVVGDRIAVISDTVTGGTTAQLLSGGVFDPTPILLGPGDAAYDGTIADDRGVPIAAFRDLNNVLTVRRFAGAGDVRDPGTWSAATLPGVQPSLATGPAGAWLQYRSALLGPWAVQPLQDAAPTGRAVQVSPDDGNTDDGELLQDASGRLRSMYVTSETLPERLVARTMEAGGGFGGAALVAQADDLSRLRASMTADGGGISVFERSQGGVRDIAASAFGTLSPTLQPGAGSRAGTGIPGGEAGCQLVKFGVVQARPRAGACFLPSIDPAYRGAMVSEGEIDLNGLAIIPSAGGKIIIDPRRRTIDSTGDVRVVLRGGGLPELTIMRGRLHLKLDGDKALSGRSLLNLPANGLDLGGFPIGGSIDVRLTADGVRIPLSLTLPKALGGISGEAVLAVRISTGVTVESARIRAKSIPLGPLAIEDLDIGYAADQWDGKALLRLPPPRTGAGLGVEVTFRNGRFVRGAVKLELPGLGVPIGPNVYFTGARGSFSVEPITMSVGGSIGVMPITPVPPKFTATADGDITLRIAKEVELDLKVNVLVLGMPVNSATGLVTTGGYGELNGQFGVDIAGVLKVAGTMGFAIDGPSKRFAGKIAGQTEIAGVPVNGGGGVISNAGTALCGTLVGGHLGAWIPFEGTPEIFGDFGGCEAPLQGYGGPPVARTAQAGVTTFAVPADSRSVSVEVTGVGGAPAVALVGPGGQRVVPGPPAQGATSFAVPVAAQSQTIVALQSPAAGTWTVEAQPGSVPIAGVRAALPAPEVTVRGSLRGSGRARTLRYTATGLEPGTSVQVYEDAGRMSRPLGVITRSSGTLRLKAGEGSPGRRTLVGYVQREAGGTPQPTISIASYQAPGAAAAPRVRGARASLRRGRATVTWRRSGAAAGYLVSVRLRDGRVLTRTVGRRVGSVRIGGLGANARLRSATVRSMSASRLLGPTARASIRR
jgi:hypothetical protein